jgi:hypothetical protein
MWSYLSTAIPPTSPITQWWGSGWGQAGSSTKPGAIPLRSTDIPSASRSKTRAFRRASVALVADCCAPNEGAKRTTLHVPKSIPAKTTYSIILEVIVSILQWHFIWWHFVV